MFYISDTTRVRFQHYVHFNENTEKSKLKHLGETLCKIETKREDGEWYLWLYGIALCSNKEISYNKAIGRKVSLRKALSHVEPKSLRKDFWEAYFRHTKK